MEINAFKILRHSKYSYFHLGINNSNQIEVYHRRVLITSAHVYVLHLAIADFLFILNLPIIIQQRLQAHNWNLGRSK